MKLPRNIGGNDLVRSLSIMGYLPVHQTGSHVRLKAIIDGTPHAITIPLHNPLRVGTLHGILKDVAEHHHIPLSRLIDELFP
ncbi:MAG: YcfA-like protein [Methanoregulaceae archaeon PtaB.Bin108]|jgi:predicted RNA binding protein YcfA (HicA-like mRNA interferase family)|nr:MAG: YcfA-like protein [Methanoregulaceae archaeon PtaB.Bin108]OPY45556.1 MAG: YcfA-like protein [Methanoregulaceae archaeon PtaU1.Bin222]